MRVRYRLRSSSSTCMRDQHDSTIAPSKQSPTEPIVGSSREANAEEAVWVRWLLRGPGFADDRAAVVDRYSRCAGAVDAAGREPIGWPTTRRLKVPRHDRAAGPYLPGSGAR